MNVRKPALLVALGLVLLVPATSSIIGDRAYAEAGVSSTVIKACVGADTMHPGFVYATTDSGCGTDVGGLLERLCSIFKCTGPGAPGGVDDLEIKVVG